MAEIVFTRDMMDKLSVDEDSLNFLNFGIDIIRKCQHIITERTDYSIFVNNVNLKDERVCEDIVLDMLETLVADIFESKENAVRF